MSETRIDRKIYDAANLWEDEGDPKKKDASKYRYSGEFMKQFSWGEFYMSELDDLYYEE